MTKRVLAADPKLSMSISATTRPPRPGEQDGKDYFFWDRARFEAERDAGGFLEHAVVFDNLYGTPRAPVMTWIGQGFDVVFDIDWQGARQLAAQTSPTASSSLGQPTAPLPPICAIFVLPPSMATLETRLRARAGDTDDIIAKRMSRAHDEISHWDEYDYVVVNDDLDEATTALRTIITGFRNGDTQTTRRHSRTGQADLPARIERLLAEKV